MRLCNRTHGGAHALVRCDEGGSHGTASFLYLIYRTYSAAHTNEYLAYALSTATFAMRT